MLQPLNPILRERKNQKEFLKMTTAEDLNSKYAPEGSYGDSSVNHSSQQEGGSSSDRGRSNQLVMSSLQRAARRTLMNYANMRKSSINFDFTGSHDEETKGDGLAATTRVDM